MDLERRESSAVNRYLAKVNLGYSNYLGIERKIIERLFIGAEARLFYIGGYYDWYKDSKERSRGTFRVDFFDAYSLYLKISI